MRAERRPLAGPPRLLLIDDDEAVLRPVASYLRKLGYEVETARAREEGEGLLACRRFDLLILDLALTPFGREGLEVLASVRRARLRLPVVLMSGNVTSEVEDDARRLGAERVLTKPHPLVDLGRLVASILSRERAAPPGPAGEFTP
jgi:DNA-binding response OmpR family regulator